MQRLEYLNLENAELTNVVLQQLNDAADGDKSPENHFPLKELRLSGNPLRCDCQLRWLWAAAKSAERHRKRSRRRRRRKNEEAFQPTNFDLPRCATPFSVKNMRLTSLKGELTLSFSVVSNEPFANERLFCRV